MKQIHKYDTGYHIDEPDLHQQDTAEGVTCKSTPKMVGAMICKHVYTGLWDYGIGGVAEIMSLIYTSTGDIDGCVPLSRLRGENIDLPEYLDFGFHDQIW